MKYETFYARRSPGNGMRCTANISQVLYRCGVLYKRLRDILDGMHSVEMSRARVLFCCIEVKKKIPKNHVYSFSAFIISHTVRSIKFIYITVDCINFEHPVNICLLPCRI